MSGMNPAAVLRAIGHWYDTTHSEEMGHDHHCPVRPGAVDVDHRCTCGRTDAAAALDGIDHALATLTERDAAPVMRLYFGPEKIAEAKRALGRAGNDAEGIMFLCADAVVHVLNGGVLDGPPLPSGETL
jgi:hypothetical protein